MKKKEIFFVLLLLLVAVGILAVRGFQRGSADYGYVEITIDGESVGIYSLKEDRVINIGSTNVCKISDGKCSMIEAECPDQICVHTGAIGKEGGMIVCLPNKVVIESTDKEGSPAGSDIDAIVY